MFLWYSAILYNPLTHACIHPPTPQLSISPQHDSTKHKERSFADFFPLHTPEFRKRLKIITMSDFITQQGSTKGFLSLPSGENGTAIRNAAIHCEIRAKSPRSCFTLNGFLESMAYNPSFRAKDGCVVFDTKAYRGQPMEETPLKSTQYFCGPQRNITYWTLEEFGSPALIHFRANEKEYRLLTHFYSILHFNEPAMDN